MRIQLSEISSSQQTMERNLSRPSNGRDRCLLCEAPLDRVGGELEMLTDLTILVDEESKESDDSQGFYPVGPDCMKRARRAAKGGE